MGLAFYSTMLDARCEGIEDAADLHAGHLLFHTNRKKGESHSKSFFFFYSNPFFLYDRILYLNSYRRLNDISAQYQNLT